MVCLPLLLTSILLLFVAVVVVSDRETGVSKGFGFVTYDSIDAANKAMQQMNDQVIPVFPASLVTKNIMIGVLTSFSLCFVSLPFLKAT